MFDDKLGKGIGKELDKLDDVESYQSSNFNDDNQNADFKW